MSYSYSSVKLVCKHLTGLNARLSNRKIVGALEWLKHRIALNLSGWRHLVLWYTDTKQWIYL